ncbi:SulP family inorganic anion transporter [Chryseobacterium indologenes]|uniref:SulP family inorganic anion transporter n=2 Tax=Chryseobacterium indologenes TaxID=253 RepID=A0A1Z3W895_CHRID|nr:SulP family inorganic anion transporter [Chryseobacterium indologenes]ASE63990.1 SulP family inorganic anion transporter [Chryseobacterium indologenes]ATN04071.1 SulP family inorganic anion transporter [Chryseobacterium indologenes]AYY83265.1 SulP family inorganic anion transporter [Chryseobacterium indologenes]AYZ37094.1 SulP family inorganic anion transporter [Chryseobacterium indologenes]AZB19780.1 SulP family inorganic anion transporter [Chryseobacterium indologenes]
MKNTITLSDFPKKINYKNELLAGFTVAMTMIPESLSFAILAGLSPLTGLYAAFMMGLVTAVFGGRPGMVSGGAGATIVVLIALIQSHGIEYLFATVALAGILQMLVGIFKLGKFVRLIPQPVMYGFLNGLAIIIFMAQIEQFKITDSTGATSWLQGTSLYIMGALTALTIAIVYFFPKLTKAVPASLIAIMVVFAIVLGFHINTKTVADIAHISGSLPVFHIPQVPFSLETLQIIFPYAMIMAGVGLIESLLTLSMVDEITNSKGNTNKESIAQGLANVTNGFFGGMGGCAMVAQTLVNLNAGSRARLSGIIASLMILMIILFGAPVIEKIPMAALVGVMMMVAISTFQWVSIRIVNKMPKSDIFIGITVALITVILHNLALAVLIGVIISALVFAWDNAKRIRAKKHTDEHGIKHYEISGPLFFGSVTAFADKFDPMNDPEEIVVDFKESRIVDMSAIDALDKLSKRYKQMNKTVYLRHLSEDCRKMLKNAEAVVEVNIQEDPTYKVMPER